ncbi:aspartate aminotransferase family protein [Flammeovirgaceae bacterium SG7u.111]|nr:aspartate aminotransferase family protein [Flammeovirgaceae bacterium SG7u.132]WPO38265.1 aspartate aminotransferase family protein [Flammeovirgaceae bacterium SG7u.111]
MAVNQGENITHLHQSVNRSETNQALINRDSSVFFHQALSSPVFNSVTGVDGAYLIDGEGNRYLDLHGNGVHTVGYNNPKVLAAIQNQLASGMSFAPRRFTNEQAVTLAEKLVAVAPEGLSRVLFCPGGSEAIEMATMLAKLTTGKWKTLSYYGTFHGAGFQAVSIGADPHFRQRLGPVMPGAIHLELPDYYRNPWGWTNQEQIDEEYLRQLETQIEYNPEIAALISEPIFYNSTVPTKYYWQRVKDICERNGILLIFDEIYTAFGRTGKMFASEHFVTPDILVVGKAFGGGVVPFAGIIGKEGLNTIQDKSIGHYTHEKSPLCSAVATAVIDCVEEDHLVVRTAELGVYFKDGLEVLKEEFSLIGNVSGLGLNLALDLVKDRITKERAVEEAHQLMEFCMKKNISLKLIQGNILNIKPALIITKEEIDYILHTFWEGLQEIESKRKSE